MSQYGPTRRRFLKAMTALAGGAALGNVFEAEEALATELFELRNAALSPAALRERYMIANGVTYLNHASIGTIPRAVHRARMEYLALSETNPWLFMWSGIWDEPREAVRAAAGSLLGAPAARIALTHNTTEGFNLLANGLDLGPGDEVLFSSLNHDGASVCWDNAAVRGGFSVRRFPFPLADIPSLTSEDVVDLHMREIRPETRVLVFPHIDNIVGLRHPMKALAAGAKAAGVEFVCVDAAQSAGMIPISVADTAVDAFSTSPHKWMQAPKGLGVLYLSEAIAQDLRPMWVTWGQDRWAGSIRIYEDYGTRNLAEVLALGDALEFQEGIGSGPKVDRYREMRAWLRARTEDSPTVGWASPETWELGGSVMTLSFDGAIAAAVSDSLFRDHNTIVRPFSVGGLNGLRVSPNVFNTVEELEFLIRTVERLVG